MKLKLNMPEASHWKCLLLAHNFENYESYYSLTDVMPNYNLLPKKNSSTIILNKLKEGNGMNNSFITTYNYNSEKIKKWILEENYIKLQNLLNE
jgi:hypothetical protein